ncbi:dihydropteroate synthase [Noviherbaspirillum massiliense]|uniref:dihydropteroate synthase n=1 Tax=Noviherbaspirillum massiliense TaxID=1465823 RepID=UPI0002E064AB|nr:dihydropteroate synthase [Noviherbaspirillum massiliense]
MQTYLQCGRYRLSLDQSESRTYVMGILNVTPDSFSDGGRHHSLERALSHAEQMIADGVDIIDIGGESTRPGAPPVSVEEELQRVMPVLYALRDCGKPLSVDTCKPEVMREAIMAGADMINDIKGFTAQGALSVVKESDCALCIMHMQNDPQTMQLKPEYEDVTREVTAYLRERIRSIEQENIDRRRLCIDPGFGFGKTLEHNLALLKNIDWLQKELDLPVLAGLSRKSMIGAITGRQVEQRLAGSLAAALAAAAHGARIVRVHDVAETVDALTVWRAAS